MSFYRTKAVREGQTMKKRLLIEKQKAIEKMKAAEKRRKQRDVLEAVESVEFDTPAFETAALYYADVKLEREVQDDDSDTSHHSVYFSNHFLNKCCRSILRSNRGLKLSFTQVLCFTFFLEVPIIAIVRDVYIVQKWGGMMLLLIYTIIGFAICVPVHMLYMFAGIFTKRSYVRFWDCVPILKGVAFSLGGICMYQEILNIIYSAIAIKYAILMFSPKLPWHNCEYENAAVSCVPLWARKVPFTKRCCALLRHNRSCTYEEQIRRAFKYSAFDYYNRYIIHISADGKYLPSFDSMLITIIAVIWVIMFVMLVLGLKRIAKVMTIINLVMLGILVPIAFIVFFISPKYSMIYEFRSEFFQSTTDYKFWLHTGLNIIHRELPADVIAYGAISTIGISVTVDTALIYILKFFFAAVFTIWMSIGVKYQLTFYQIKYSKCIMTNGNVLFFALFPDIISHMPAPQLWLIIYYLFIFFWGLSTAIYVYMAFIEAVFEEFQDLLKWRLIICAVVCTAAGWLSISKMSPGMMERIRIEAVELIPQLKVFMLCISFIGVYFYSITTFRHDYHFFTGEILGNYWTVGLKVSMLFVIISSILSWFNFLYQVKYYPMMWSAIPVLLGIIIGSMKYGVKIEKSLITPSPRWGPSSRPQKLARIKFDPSHDLHYRSVTQKCQHTCLLYSNSLKKETKHWINRKNEEEGKESHEAFPLTESKQLSETRSGKVLKTE